MAGLEKNRAILRAVTGLVRDDVQAAATWSAGLETDDPLTVSESLDLVTRGMYNTDPSGAAGVADRIPDPVIRGRALAWMAEQAAGTDPAAGEGWLARAGNLAAETGSDSLYRDVALAGVAYSDEEALAAAANIREPGFRAQTLAEIAVRLSGLGREEAWRAAWNRALSEAMRVSDEGLFSRARASDDPWPDHCQDGWNLGFGRFRTRLPRFGGLRNGVALITQCYQTHNGGQTMGWTVEVDKDKCVGDEQCVEVCPVDVYEMVDGKAEPVNMDECLGCESCGEVCEEGAITVTEN